MCQHSLMRYMRHVFFLQGQIQELRITNNPLDAETQCETKEKDSDVSVTAASTVKYAVTVHRTLS